ncbi:helix-turn-helix transcriptional regulator [Bacteroidales bacterium OttesenSCG-928-M11]|nr:helix-turn-helix transcriptional regulator [Bacteroidales bacterium OttesenSCG-928-M11]
MSRLIVGNYFSLLVLSRFNIPLGFEDKTIAEVCKENNVDTQTFLTIVNLHINGEKTGDYKNISLPSMMEYLHQAHSFFLEYRLPEIREKLLDALNADLKTLNQAVIGYFDSYVEAVTKHMMYEEENLFPYVRSLLEGHKSKHYNIHVFSRQHDAVESKLTEFKNILIKYYPAQSTNKINSVLFDIFSCEKDLASHNAIEDNLFVPAIEQIENKHKDNSLTLTTREKEIIVCIIKGLSNKQIAEQLCISTHTVISHRKNITQKLQIHSAAGLTIYAIVNKLVDIEDLDVY